MSETAKIDDCSSSPQGEVIAEITADGWVRIKKSGLKTHMIYVDVYRNGLGRRVAGVAVVPLVPDTSKGEVVILDNGSFLGK